MPALKLILPLLSFLMSAAHSLRGGDTGWFLIWLTLSLFLLMQGGWVRLVLKTALAWAAVKWGIATYIIINMKLSIGMPWLRPALIMTAAFTVITISFFIMGSPSVKEKFSRESESALPPALVFIVTFTLLELLRVNLPLEIILLERFLPGLGSLEIFFLSLYGVLIVKKMLDPDRTAKTRGYTWIFFSALFFLQLILGLAGMEKMLMTGKLHLPVPALIIAGPVYRGSSFFMPLLFLSTVILAGPAWCSHLCYIGSWDDRLSRLRKVKIRGNPPWAGKVRAGILILAILIPLVLNFAEVPVMTAVAAGALFGIAGIPVMALISSRRGTMVHCTLYCPVGLAADILGRISPWRIRIDERCNGCGRCTRACRYNALNREDLEKKRPGLSCTLCGDCIPQCDESHIAYTFPGISPERARTAFIVLIVILHTLFLGVARI